MKSTKFKTLTGDHIPLLYQGTGACVFARAEEFLENPKQTIHCGCLKGAVPGVWGGGRRLIFHLFEGMGQRWRKGGKRLEVRPQQRSLDKAAQQAANFPPPHHHQC